MAITPVALTYPLMRDGDTDYLNSSLLSNLKQKANLLQRKLTSLAWTIVQSCGWIQKRRTNNSTMLMLMG